MMNLKNRLKQFLLPCCFWRRNNKEKHVYPFFSLTPDSNAKRIDAYQEAMDYALSRDDIKNIAVTGPYGAGKSSFLETYFKNHDDVLRISLAAFLGGMENASNNADEQEDGDINPVKARRAENERRLELSILQQIFYKFSADAVPYSRLSKTVSVSIKWYLSRVLWTVTTLMAIFGVWQPDFFTPFVSQPIRVWIASWDWMIFWTSGSILLVAFGFLAYEVLRLIKMRCVQSVDVSGLGIQMAEHTERSILNRNIDEIIYHFEASKYRTVIIEDIDRFDDVDIFTKLREVNLLLNNAEQIPASHKPIRFVYALKEELFKEKVEKVKFFDFVIPIVPVVNASNSRGILHKYLEDKCQINEPNTPGLKKFVKDVSLYVSDMRLLKNICNEFYTYRKQIPDCTAPVELLGMIVFKNFFPREFVAMHQDDGLIKALFEIKDSAIEEVVERFEKKIDECRRMIDCITEEKATDIFALQKLYFYELIKKLVGARQVDWCGTSVQVGDLLRYDDWFEVLRKDGMRYHDGYRWRCVEWREIENKCDPSCSYDEHVKRIEARENGGVRRLREQIEDLRRKQIQTRRMSLVDLMDSGYVSNGAIGGALPAEYDKWQEHDLLVALVRGGYINERYRHYISMFYDVEGASSRKDFYFETSVAKGEESDWCWELENVNDVIENIDIHYFAKNSILNYALCDALLKCPELDKTKAFFGLLASGGRKAYEFIDGFLKGSWSAREKCSLLNAAFAINPNYVVELISFSTEGEGLSREVVECQLGYYISWVLRSGVNTNIADEVRKFIEDTANVVDILKVQGIVTPEDQAAFVKKFGVKFCVLDFDSAKESGFLDVVISFNAYTINDYMLKGVLAAKGEAIEGFDRQSWTLVHKSKIFDLVNYVKAEFPQYLKHVYLKQSPIQEDSEDAALSVLNREDVTDEDKKLFLSKQWSKSQVSDAKAIKSAEALKLCVDSDWILPSWNNAAEIWNRNKDSHALFWKYVGREKCYEKLSQKRSRGIEWKDDERWARSFAESNELSDDAVVALLRGMNKGIIVSYTGQNATPVRIQRFVKAGRIQYSSTLFQQLKAVENDSHIAFAALLVKDFCAEFDEGLIDVSDAIKLLKSDCLNRRNVPLLANTLRRFITMNDNVATAVAQLLNEGNYRDVDEGVLDATLASLTPESLQCKVIQHLAGTTDAIRERLGKMKDPYSRLAGSGCRPELPFWNGLPEFLEFLEKVGIVSSIDPPKDGKIQVNTKRHE